MINILIIALCIIGYFLIATIFYYAYYEDEYKRSDEFISLQDLMKDEEFEAEYKKHNRWISEPHLYKALLPSIFWPWGVLKFIVMSCCYCCWWD